MIRTTSTLLAASLLTLFGASAMAAPTHAHHRQLALVANAEGAAPSAEGAGTDKKVEPKADKKDKKVKAPKMHIKEKAPATAEGAAPTTEKAPEKTPAKTPDKAAEKTGDKK